MQDPSFWQLFNWLDIVLAIGIVAAFLIGLGAGFYRQLAITCSLMLGFVLASQLTTPLAAADFWDPLHARLGQNGAEACAFGAIVFACLFVGGIAVLCFRGFFNKTVRFVDSILGGFTGATIGALLFGIIFLAIFHWEDTRFHEPIRKSYLGSHLAEGARVASRVFPEDFRKRVDASLNQRAGEDLAGGNATPATDEVEATVGTDKGDGPR